LRPAMHALKSQAGSLLVNAGHMPGKREVARRIDEVSCWGVGVADGIPGCVAARTGIEWDSNVRSRLSIVYAAAAQEKWLDTIVGRPVVQAFAGSLEGHRARKGVMITTSTFSQEAKDYVQKIEKKIVLIDGKQLAQLMIEHDVGVTVTKVYPLKKLDQDFFEAE